MLFLVPNLSMLGYLVGRRRGAAIYNPGHSYLGPASLALLGWRMAEAQAFNIALIWTAHIGFDRMMGFGLKYSTGFGATHLGFTQLGRRGG